MRLKQYLILEKKYIARPNQIKKAARDIAKRIKVDVKYLDYVGTEDYEHMGIMLYFNVTDHKHEKYRSTVVQRRRFRNKGR